MENNLICILMIAGCLNYSHIASKSGADQSFGKTHFIVGLPKEQHMLKTDVMPAQIVPLPFENSRTQVKHAFFSPDDNIKKILIDLIEAEKRGIKVTAFMLTDKDIAQALVDAQQRGVSIEVIINGNSNKDKFSKVDMLKEAHIKVYTYESQSTGLINDIMHHKFIIFKDNMHHKSLLWTGSFNLTKTANDKNHENVLIVEEPCLIEQYTKRFDYMKTMIDKAARGELSEQEAMMFAKRSNKKVGNDTRFTQATSRKHYTKGRLLRKNIINHATKLV